MRGISRVGGRWGRNLLIRENWRSHSGKWRPKEAPQWTRFSSRGLPSRTVHWFGIKESTNKLIGNGRFIDPVVAWPRTFDRSNPASLQFWALLHHAILNLGNKSKRVNQRTTVIGYSRSTWQSGEGPEPKLWPPTVIFLANVENSWRPIVRINLAVMDVFASTLVISMPGVENEVVPTLNIWNCLKYLMHQSRLVTELLLVTGSEVRRWFEIFLKPCVTADEFGIEYEEFMHMYLQIIEQDSISMLCHHRYLHS